MDKDFDVEFTTLVLEKSANRDQCSVARLACHEMREPSTRRGFAAIAANRSQQWSRAVSKSPINC